MQLLSNLFRVGWKWRNADIICYMLTSLVSLKQGNVKKFQKLGKMWLMIKWKVTKTEGSTLSLEDTFLKNYGGDKIDTPSLLSIKHMGIVALILIKLNIAKHSHIKLVWQRGHQPSPKPVIRLKKYVSCYPKIS